MAGLSSVSVAVSRELILQIVAVGDDNDLEAAQLFTPAHFANQEDHRQALARSLRVPDDAAASVVLAVLSPRLAVRRRSTALRTARNCW